jgi:hypothetical protein
MAEQLGVNAVHESEPKTVHEKMHVALKNKCVKLKQVTKNVLLRFKHKTSSNRLH